MFPQLQSESLDGDRGQGGRSLPSSYKAHDTPSPSYTGGSSCNNNSNNSTSTTTTIADDNNRTQMC